MNMYKKKLLKTEAIITVIVLFLLLGIIGCKTPVAIEKTTSMDSVNVKGYSRMNYEEIMRQIYSSLDCDFDYTLIEWSKPDSSGHQYKEKVHIIKAKITAIKEDTINIKSAEFINCKDSTALMRTDRNIVTPQVKSLSWWDKIRLGVSNWMVIIFSVGGVLIIIWLVRRNIFKRS